MLFTFTDLFVDFQNSVNIQHSHFLNLFLVHIKLSALQHTMHLAKQSYLTVHEFQDSSLYSNIQQ